MTQKQIKFILNHVSCLLVSLLSSSCYYKLVLIIILQFGSFNSRSETVTPSMGPAVMNSSEKWTEINGRRFSQTDMFWMKVEAHILRLKAHAIYVLKEIKNNAHFKKYFENLIGKSKLVLTAIFKHDSEKLDKETIKFLKSIEGKSVHELPEPEKSIAKSNINDMNARGVKAWESQMYKADLLDEVGGVNSTGKATETMEELVDRLDVPLFRRAEIGENVLDLYDFMQKYPEQFNNLKFDTSHLEELARVAHDNQEVMNGLKKNAQFLSNEEYIKLRSKTYGIVDFDVIQEKVEDVLNNDYEFWLAAEKTGKPIPHSLLSDRTIIKIQKNINNPKLKKPSTPMLTMSDSLAVLGRVGDVLALGEAARVWRQFNSPKHESTMQSITEAVHQLTSEAGFGAPDVGARCENDELITSDKEKGIKRRFDLLQGLIKRDQCLNDKYFFATEMKCESEQDLIRKNYINSSNTNKKALFIKSKSPERGTFESTLEFKDNNIQSLTIKQNRNNNLSSISITKDIGSSYSFCLQAPVIVFDTKNSYFLDRPKNKSLTKIVCAKMKNINDVSVLKRIDKQILSQIPIDMFKEFRRVSDTFSEYYSDIIQCCGNQECLANISENQKFSNANQIETVK